MAEQTNERSSPLSLMYDYEATSKVTSGALWKPPFISKAYAVGGFLNNTRVTYAEQLSKLQYLESHSATSELDGLGLPADDQPDSDSGYGSRDDYGD